MKKAKREMKKQIQILPAKRDHMQYERREGRFRGISNGPIESTQKQDTWPEAACEWSDCHS